MAQNPTDNSLRQLATRVEAGDFDESLLNRLAADPRAGAAALLARARKRREIQAERLAHLESLLALERGQWQRGARHIAGVDEAGLGPLAGPVMAAAVILDRRSIPLGIDDSKKLDEKTRERLAAEIRASAVAVSVGIADVEEIDRLNVYHAGLLSMRRAVEGLASRPCHVLVDARRIPGLTIEQSAYIKGDARSASIAAASIIAKTARDALMKELDATYPGYGFSRHKGYGTEQHRDAIRRLGPCPVHRMSYAAVRDLIGR
ncbi:MAG: ribonuclease HII [Deltaproteobacteria bacterium]|nr:ribonuclease HII [Deltaproteobacteria bacterium]